MLIRLVDEVVLCGYVMCYMVMLDYFCVVWELDYDECVDGIEVIFLGVFFVVIDCNWLDLVLVS